MIGLSQSYLYKLVESERSPTSALAALSVSISKSSKNGSKRIPKISEQVKAYESTNCTARRL
jgi:hypothetical protein